MEVIFLIVGFFILCWMTPPEWIGEKLAVVHHSYEKHMEKLNELE